MSKSKPVDRDLNALWPIMQQAAGLPDDETALKKLKASMGPMVDARQQMENAPARCISSPFIARASSAMRPGGWQSG